MRIFVSACSLTYPRPIFLLHYLPKGRFSKFATSVSRKQNPSGFNRIIINLPNKFGKLS